MALHHVARRPDVLPERVDTERGSVADRLVQVDGGAIAIVRAGLHRYVGSLLEIRLLADLVDHAARRAAPEVQRRRAVQHVDRFEVEPIAIVLAAVTETR